MTGASRDELHAIASRGAVELHDTYSERALDRALEEYRARRREKLTPFVAQVDGTAYPSVLHAILASTPFAQLTLDFPEATESDPAWEFLRPARSLILVKDGAAALLPLGANGSPVRGVARLLLRETYLPRSAIQDHEATRGVHAAAPRADLFTLSSWAQFVRQTGVVPFSTAVLLYFPEERIRYELDLIDNGLLPDLRHGRLRGVAHVRRSSRIAHAVDRYVARGDVSLPNARALEVVFETRGVTAIDLAPLFGGVRERATSSLETLRDRGLVVVDRPSGQYRPNLDAVVPAPDRSRAGRTPTEQPANPLLRTSVAELLAAADARAT
ncbi:MAG: hypothetical protein L3J97_04340 [Thermoplasmata archaeon]|nr:hypothetical protein [Thermoplasmata archaeon]